MPIFETYKEAKSAYPNCDAVLTTAANWSGGYKWKGLFIPVVELFDETRCVHRYYDMRQTDKQYWIEPNAGWIVASDPCKGRARPKGSLQPENGGGSCNYYFVHVSNPTTVNKPYNVECNDLIESLGLTFAEANIYKEIFRTANGRAHGNGKAGNTELRAAEKVLFYAMRNAVANGVDLNKAFSDMNTGNDE